MDETASETNVTPEAHEGEAQSSTVGGFTDGRILLVSFHGWNDAGSAASNATALIGDELDITVPMHSIRDERYFDYSVTRPSVERKPRGDRRIRWPRVTIFAPRHLSGLDDIDESDAADEERDSGSPVAFGDGDVPLFDVDFGDTITVEVTLDPEATDGDVDDDIDAAFAEPRNLAGDAELRVTADNRRNVFIMHGPEPTLQWRAFSAEVIAACKKLGITRLVLVGSLLADVPHSRPLSVFLSSEYAPFRNELGIGRSEYSGPTGALSALGHLAAAEGIPSVAVWGSVPHYASQSPSPKAELAIVDKLEELVDVTIPRAELIARAEEWERDVNAALEDDSDIADYIAYLERAHDTVEAPEASGEAIAKEFERFLRQDDASGGQSRGASGPGWTGPIPKPGQQPPVSQPGALTSDASDEREPDVDDTPDVASDGPEPSDEPDSPESP